MKLYGYDAEIHPNLILFVFKDYITKEYLRFERSLFRNDIPDLIKFIDDHKNQLYLFSFNGKGFDDQLLYHVYTHPNDSLLSYKQKANEIIESDWGVYPFWDIEKIIKQPIDLMVINNYGIHSAKTTSLKWLEFNFRLPSIKDLPVDHNKPINTEKNAEKLFAYCCLDVDTTEQEFDISKPLIKYRQEYSKLVGLNLINDSEVSLAKKVITKLFSKKMNIDEKDFKKLRTYRDKIIVKDVIVDIDFKLDIHKKLLNHYNNIILNASVKSEVRKNTKVISLKNAINYNLEYSNSFSCDYGAGGLHGVVSPGIYEEDNEYRIDDFDFGSWYPHLIALFNLEPAHLPKGMLGDQLMEWYNERVTKYPKKTHWDLNYAIKIIINLLYGLMGSEYSPVYDIQAQLAVCVNGMLQVTKMMEIVLLNGGEILYANTDGWLVKSKKQDYAKIEKELFDYAKKLKVPLERVGVKKLILNDVNNFILVNEYKEIKEKGAFETYETISAHNNYHKDTSAMIVPKALKEYFINGTPVEETIDKENNIYLFCLGVKGGSKFEFVDSENGSVVFKEVKSYNQDGEWMYELVEQQVDPKKGIIKNTVHNVRALRYFIAKEGSTLTKLWKETSKKGVSFNSVEATSPVKILQTIKKADIYDIRKSNGSYELRYNSNNEVIHRYEELDRQWYVDKCYDIINNIENSEIIN